MIIILKTLLAILAIFGISIAIFLGTQYYKFSSSDETENLSVINKFSIMMLAYGAMLIFSLIGILSVLMLFNNITIQ